MYGCVGLLTLLLILVCENKGMPMLTFHCHCFIQPVCWAYQGRQKQFLQRAII